MARMTTAAAARLHDELAELDNVARPAAQRAIDEAQASGSGDENPDLQVAFAEMSRVDARIGRIRRRLAESTISDDVGDCSTVEEGLVVAVSFAGDPTVERYLVGSLEEFAPGCDGIVTPGSPMGAALLGAAAGDTVTFNAGAADVAITVVAITAPA